MAFIIYFLFTFKLLPSVKELMLLQKELCLGIPSVKNVWRREILKKNYRTQRAPLNYWCVHFVLFMLLKQKLELSYLCLLSLLESRLIFL